jgi:soluble lytic murein transglycosylase-like protein
MSLGPKLVIRGTILGIIFLVGFLLLVTAGISYPVPALAAGETTPAPAAAPAQQPQPPSVAPANPLLGQSVSTSLETNVSQQKPVVQEAASSCRISGKYPESVLQWCDLITEYADKRGFDPNLIAGLIWQESGGNPTAYSKSGAVGLMQVMPRDGLAASFMCPNGPCFSERPTTQELQDPGYNIAYGTRMLSSLLNKHGNLRDALKAYGPKDVGYYYADKVLGIFQNYGQ